MQLADNQIIINPRGLYTADKKGNKYFRGTAQLNINMTLKRFRDAQTFWANQQLNGFSLSLIGLEILAVSNSFIPYNIPNEKSIIPIEGKQQMQNRAIWYNVTFNMGNEPIKTGWMCNGLYATASSASENAANAVVCSLMFPCGIMRSLEMQLNQKTR